jgi:outer membrane receptor protein involved in Fe transport
VVGNKEDVESFTKSNLQIGYERESWSATLFVRNLTNEKANTYTGSGATYAAEFWGHDGFGETRNYARPRTISLRLTKRFN